MADVNDADRFKRLECFANGGGADLKVGGHDGDGRQPFARGVGAFADKLADFLRELVGKPQSGNRLNQVTHWVALRLGEQVIL